MYDEDKDDLIILEQIKLGKIAKKKQRIPEESFYSKKFRDQLMEEGSLSQEELWFMEGYESGLY